MIGYAATHDELFLIYEYALKGPLKNHLHDPQNKGKISCLFFFFCDISLWLMLGLGVCEFIFLVQLNVIYLYVVILLERL